MHDDEIPVTPEMVRKLVETQFPQWRGESVTRVGSNGTVNAIFRLGETLTARFPLRPMEPAAARAWLAEEAAAARELCGHTRFATPEPVAIGEPGEGYPLPWSVQTWLPGHVATDHDPGASEAFARDLSEFVQSVRGMDTRGRTFRGTGRGGNLRDHDDWIQTCLRESEGLLDVPRLRAMWAEMRDLPRGDYPDTMTHGDLIPGNVLVRDDRLAGVLDVGGLGVADRSLDLVGAWHLLDDGPRRTFRDTLGCGDLEWERGRAWAFQQSLGAVWYYVTTNRVMSEMGRRTLDRLMD
jgi:aminoglycoside phosphotransferase (APT) family kinase protein